MSYLFFQTFLWILAAFILGLLIGWWFCGRCKCNKSTDTSVSTSNSLKSEVSSSTATVSSSTASNSTKNKKATTAKVAAGTAAAAATTAKAKAKTKKKPVAKTSKAKADAAVDVDDGWKPQGFTSRPSDADELKRIKGIGPVIEKTLNGLGVYQFKQIASFDKDNISWVENYLSFPGRIEREDWISQAKDLAAGKDTAFSKRVDKGDLDY